MDQEILSSDIVEKQYIITKQLTNTDDFSDAWYETSAPNPNFVSTQIRMNKDTNCQASDYKFYGKNGVCGNPALPGETLNWRAWNRISPPVSDACSNTKFGTLPSVRTVSLAITKCLNGTPAPDTAAVPNMFTIGMMQMMVHDTKQTSSKNSYGLSACNALTCRNKLLTSPDNTLIDISRSDPFYSSCGVRCLSMTKNLVLNENGKIQKSSWVRFSFLFNKF